MSQPIDPVVSHFVRSLSVHVSFLERVSDFVEGMSRAFHEVVLPSAFYAAVYLGHKRVHLRTRDSAKTCTGRHELIRRRQVRHDALDSARGTHVFVPVLGL